MLILTTVLALSALAAWAAAITLPAVALLRAAGSIIARALVRLVKGS